VSTRHHLGIALERALDAAVLAVLILVAIYTFPRTTVDWDTSQADDIRTRGVSWMNKRQMDRGRAPRSDRKSLA
jgi:hypothetical protein